MKSLLAAGLVATFALAANVAFLGAGTFKAEHEGRSAHIVKLGIGYTHLEDKQTGRAYTNIGFFDSYDTDHAVAERFMSTGIQP